MIGETIPWQISSAEQSGYANELIDEMNGGRNGGAMVSGYAVYPCRLKGFGIQKVVKAR